MKAAHDWQILHGQLLARLARTLAQRTAEAVNALGQRESLRIVGRQRTCHLYIVVVQIVFVLCCLLV